MHRRAASQRHGMPRVMAVGHIPSLDPVPSAHTYTYSPSPAFPSKFFEFFHPRKSRLRATVLCLVSLVILTTYVCFVSPPILAPGHPLNPYRATHRDSWRKFAANAPFPPPPEPGPEISLSPEQELGALTAFMAALPQNVIPSNIDPMQPIDPQLVLDFDTRGPQAEEEVVDIVTDVWISNPVVVFCKFHSAVSRELKSILRAMDLKPPPTIFDVDERADADVLTPLLFRLTSSTELPILLVGGVPVGSMDTIQELATDGKLKDLIIHAGATPDSSKRHRKGRR